MSSNEAFKALADPTRREILALLRRGEMTAGALAERFAEGGGFDHQPARGAANLVRSEYHRGGRPDDLGDRPDRRRQPEGN